jgi:hypothetical protein
MPLDDSALGSPYDFDVQTWVPALRQGVALTGTVDVARYVQLGDLVFFWIGVTFTSAGTSGQAIGISLPVYKLQGATAYQGSVVVRGGGGAFLATWASLSATEAAPINESGAVTQAVGATFAVVNGDWLWGSGCYEAA